MEVGIKDYIETVLIILSIIMSFISLPISLVALSIWQGHKLSTHRIQYMSVDEMIKRNIEANEALKAVLNPADEDEKEYSIFNQSPENYMPNALNSRNKQTEN